MIHRPDGMGAFTFVVLASLRATQLIRGCLPRIDGDHTIAVTAQMEVARGAISAADRATSEVTDAPVESPAAVTLG